MCVFISIPLTYLFLEFIVCIMGTADLHFIFSFFLTKSFYKNRISSFFFSYVCTIFWKTTIVFWCSRNALCLYIYVCILYLSSNRFFLLKMVDSYFCIPTSSYLLPTLGIEPFFENSLKYFWHSLFFTKWLPIMTL